MNKFTARKRYCGGQAIKLTASSYNCNLMILNNNMLNSLIMVKLLNRLDLNSMGGPHELCPTSRNSFVTVIITMGICQKRLTISRTPH